MSLISRLFTKRPDERDAVRPLWHRIVEIAREKEWYATCGVADTVPGRFDAVTLVMALVMLRMEREEPLIAPSVHLTELFVDDMDGQLRQSGVGDLVVGKRMGKLMGVLGGRLGALREAFAAGDDNAVRAALLPVLERNVTLVEGADTSSLVSRVLDLKETLDAVSGDELLAGKIAR